MNLNFKGANDHDELDAILGMDRGSTSTDGDESTTKSADTLERELKELALEGKMNSKDKLIPFWEARQKTYGCLYKIVAVYFQIPITEVDVERLFSHVSFILNALRTHLTGNLLNDIILIRLNFDIISNSDFPLFM